VDVALLGGAVHEFKDGPFIGAAPRVVSRNIRSWRIERRISMKARGLLMSLLVAGLAAVSLAAVTGTGESAAATPVPVPVNPPPDDAQPVVFIHWEPWVWEQLAEWYAGKRACVDHCPTFDEAVAFYSVFGTWPWCCDTIGK